ncbi:MAG: CBS domain-containing protein [Pseudomonadota bacterium]
MKVKDLMTRDVATVTRDTPLKEVARVLAQKGISGVPVVDGNGHVLGVVSEADVLLKERGPVQNGGRFSWFLEPRDAADTAKLAARTAGEAMTAPAITIGPERPASAAARIMVDRGVNRLPVVEDEHLVGIVTRADLVRAFTRPDDVLLEEIRAEVVERALWIPRDQIDVTVTNGEVELSGEVESKTDAEVLERLASRVPGVVAVSSQLTWRSDERRVELAG